MVRSVGGFLLVCKPHRASRSRCTDRSSCTRTLSALALFLSSPSHEASTHRLPVKGATSLGPAVSEVDRRTVAPVAAYQGNRRLETVASGGARNIYRPSQLEKRFLRPGEAGRDAPSAMDNFPPAKTKEREQRARRAVTGSLNHNQALPVGLHSRVTRPHDY